jgi:hypothetical protein
MPQKIDDLVASYLIQSQPLARSKLRKFLDVAPVRVKRIGRNAFLDAQVTQKRSDCRFHWSPERLSSKYLLYRRRLAGSSPFLKAQRQPTSS